MKMSPPDRRKSMRELALEIGIRVMLFGVFAFTEFLEPFERVIQPEELWLYKNPLVESDLIPKRVMFAISFLTPLAVIFVVKIIRRTDKTEIKEACLVAFSGLGFTSFYLAGKLHCFTDSGRGRSWRLCAMILPLYSAMMIALSRTCDYKHHWQDAFVGGVIGLLFAYICYRQHYPPFLHTDCHLPYASLALSTTRHAPVSQEVPQATDNATSLPLEGITEGPV
ncbi:phospholipid phosphatase 4 isoform X2 [Clarias gariepinus]|uniref:phospholipid phosphatase 4 isoform X2 n=1 Tax=Clarias gariepinus TaxID=13013 RepID=UPI00234D5F9D|nr:phospholipid phosphatase 4 isoform X2 [Clarias gariepinus]